MSAVAIFDGHNDTLLRLVLNCEDPAAGFLAGGGGQLDFPLARAGGFAGGLFACFVRPDDPEMDRFQATEGGYTVAMPAPPSLAHAARLTDRMIACAHGIAERSNGVRICRDAATIEVCRADGAIAIVLHLEGAEAVGDDLQRFHDAGVRSIGPVWSRPNRFGTGVPFRYPAHPDIGPGLTETGRSLVRDCNRLGIMLDVSHLNAAGFWDLAALSKAPLVATHSNAHALCPASRNLTDDQLDAIRTSGGLVGVSLSVSELRPDGHNDPATPLGEVLRQFDYLLARLGPQGVALGSDFDGAVMPAEIGDAGGLPRLVAAMQAHGYGDVQIEALCWGNWLDILRRSWVARP